MDRLAFTSLKSVTEERVRREMLTNELANITSVGFKRSFESTMRTVKAEGSGFESRMQPQGVNTDYIKWREDDGIGRTVRNGLNFTERGFGIRGELYPEDLLVLVAAMRFQLDQASA